MNELIAAIRAIQEAWDGGDLAGAVNNAREVANLHEKNESHAENTKMAYDVMQELGVTLYDLELWGIIAGRDDVLGGPEQAFDALVADGFSLGHSNYIEHYYQATADYVGDALEERDLIKDDEEGAGWFPPLAGDEPNEAIVPIGQTKDETPDDVLERAKAVERGDLPSGSVIMKLTGPNSLATPGRACTYSHTCPEPAVAKWTSAFAGRETIYGCASHAAEARDATGVELWDLS